MKFVGHFIQKLEPNQDRQTHFVSCCDRDLDPMTLIYEFDLDILNIYLHIRNEISR